MLHNSRRNRTNYRHSNGNSSALQGQADSKKMRMNDDADIYKNSNGIPRRDAVNFLNQYKNRLNFRQYDRAVDIGSADGGVTSIIRSYLPSNFKKMVGCDINERMVKYATEHYGDERTTFRVLDIEGYLPDDMREAYDHVFSVYTLHWIRNQELAFTNIYNMLDEGGDCLLTFVANTPTHSIFQALADEIKWKQYLRTINQFVSPYHDVQEPDRLIEDMMAQIGFKEIDVRCKQMLYYYQGIQAFRETTKAINPFHIPDLLYEDFIDDYVEIARDMRLTKNVNGSTVVMMKYNLIVVFGRK